MKGTRKNIKHLPMYANTFHGLYEWNKCAFEKLGWMVLAKAKGYTYKIKPYKMMIRYLMRSIEHAMNEYTDPDRIHDLQVMHMNVQCLYAHVCKDF